MDVTAEIFDTALAVERYSDTLSMRAIDRHLESRIMMIDDEPLMMEVIQGLLEEAGYSRFVSISEPELAMGLIAQEKPDVILLDLKMPKVSGFDILEAIRQSPEHQFLPVIVLTSSTDAENKLRALEFGATDFLGKPVDPSELVLRLRNTLTAKAYQDRLAHTDEATGLPNQRKFEQEIDEAIAAAAATNTTGAVIQITIDRLKQVNESLGPHAGEQLIQQVSMRLQASDQNDLSVTHFGTRGEVVAAARLGATEFGILVAGLANLGDAGSFAGRYCKRLSGTYIVDGQELFVTAKAGIAGFPDDADSGANAIVNASAALMELKSSKGEVVSFFSSASSVAAKSRLNQENHLSKAVEKQELQLFYQPKVDVLTGKIDGAEALLRWDNDELGSVSPGDFIPLAEDSGLVVPIGSWVLRQAIAQMAVWRAEGLNLVPLSINVSPLQFTRPQFFHDVSSAIEEFNVPSKLITLEITETVLLGGGQDAINTMAKLREIGCKLSIDDFGTGYSSLSYLKKYPVDELKIDRSFIMDIDTGDSECEIVKAIVALARSLNLKVVGEGVETERQLEVLRSCHCDLYQGFLFAKPMPPDAFASRLKGD